MEKDTCKPGTLNPYYAVDLYYELETKAFWENQKKNDVKIADFAQESFVHYNCDNLIQEFPKEIANWKNLIPNFNR